MTKQFTAWPLRVLLQKSGPSLKQQQPCNAQIEHTLTWFAYPQNIKHIERNPFNEIQICKFQDRVNNMTFFFCLPSVLVQRKKPRKIHNEKSIIMSQIKKLKHINRKDINCQFPMTWTLATMTPWLIQFENRKPNSSIITIRLIFFAKTK